MTTVLVSGGFDPFHIGHLYYLREASNLGSVIVAMNSDAWLIKKKGYVFLTWNDRAEIVGALHCVFGAVHPVKDGDGTVCAALREFKPNIFANGGDRIGSDPREHTVCQELGIEELFGIGGDKIRSSRDLVNDAIFNCTGLRP